MIIRLLTFKKTFSLVCTNIHFIRIIGYYFEISSGGFTLFINVGKILFEINTIGRKKQKISSFVYIIFVMFVFYIFVKK